MEEYTSILTMEFENWKKFNSLKYPTDVQAEILVKDETGSNSILAVCFESEENGRSQSSNVFL